jgi:carbon monoxide dehydrogenase subunit G
MVTLKLKMIEKEPFSLVKICEDGDSKYDFNFWVQLKEPKEGVTKFKLTLKAKLNPMMTMMVKKPLNQAIEKLVFALENANFSNM